VVLFPAVSTPAVGATPLAPWLRRTLVGVAAVNVVLGLAFGLGPELGTAPWPTEISSALLRFIGAIVLANGIGALVVARQGTWEGARALFAVALVYGLGALVAGAAQLLITGVAAGVVFYLVLDLVFVGPIAAIIWTYESRACR
jgi:hypothetical protein